MFVMHKYRMKECFGNNNDENAHSQMLFSFSFYACNVAADNRIY